MIDMTADAVGRLEHDARAVELLAQADGLMQEAYNEARSADSEHSRRAGAIQSTGDLLTLVRDQIVDRAKEHAQMIGWQVATYEIAEIARAIEGGPIIWLTGNSYLPPLRSLEACEHVWQADTSDLDLFALMVESLERRLEELRIHMAAPEYDNALYVVDLERFEYVEEPEGDSLADEWKSIEQDS